MPINHVVPLSFKPESTVEDRDAVGNHPSGVNFCFLHPLPQPFYTHSTPCKTWQGVVLLVYANFGQQNSITELQAVN